MGASLNKSLLILWITSLLTACGGGGDSDDGEDCTGGYITIDSVDTRIGNTVTITGRAYASQYYYCDISRNCNPGVDVTFVNLASGDSGGATSYYSYFTGRHTWSANVGVVSGANRIRFRAEDPGGTYCTEAITTQIPSSKIIQTYPEELSEGVQNTTFVTVKIDGDIDPSSVNENSITVRDQNDVEVNGRIELEYSTEKKYSTLSFFPDYPLAPVTRYRIALSAKILSHKGEKLSGGHQWVFTTWNY